MTRTNAINAYGNNPAFRGEETQKSNGTGIVIPGLTTVAGGGLGYVLLKSPDKDAFESSLKDGKMPTPKEGATFSAEETAEMQKAIDARETSSSTVTNPTTSTTTSNTAGKSPELIAAEKARDAKVIVRDNAIDIINYNQTLVQEANALHTSFSAQTAAPELKPEQRTELTKQREQHKATLDRLQAELKDAQAAENKPKVTELTAKVAKEQEAIDGIDKQLNPNEFKLRAAAEKAKAEKDAAIKEQTDTVAKHNETVNAKQKALDDANKAMAEYKGKEEFTKLKDEKAIEAALKSYNDKIAAAQAELTQAQTAQTRANARAQAKVDAKTEIHTALTKPGATLETAAKEILASANYRQMEINSGTLKSALTAAEGELKPLAEETAMLRQASKISEPIEAEVNAIMNRPAIAGAEGTASKETSAFSEAVTKAFEAVKGKLEVKPNLAKAGLAALGGLVVGLGIKYMVDGNKSEA